MRGRDEYEAKQKAYAQIALWQQQYERKVDLENRRANSKMTRDIKMFGQQEANRLTNEAQSKLHEAKNLLSKSLQVNDAISWGNLKRREPFPEKMPLAPVPVELPSKPSSWKPNLTIFEHLLPWLKRRRLEKAAVAYAEEIRFWEQQCDQLRKRQARDQELFDRALGEWRTRKLAFEKEQATANAAIDEQARLYSEKEPDAITEYCELVLMRSEYPDWFNKDCAVDYDQASRTLIIDFLLPNPDTIPDTKEVRYVAAKNVLETKNLKKSELNTLYDSIVYQICLRTCHEILEADVIDAIGTMVFNGFVNYIDRGTGQQVRACILSLQADKDEFQKIDLRSVDPAQCFRRLKGLGSPALHGLVPVAPILQLRKDDARFVASQEVASRLNEGANLAAIGWEDFEHLIRELFEKEFASEGAEVRVTRASRDAGVDAVVFDPHPIRGGKIVIQAKRYTNTVDVSAVRDLYGTVVNEGATKGVLVTTSGFGPDAYAFAKGKPITLLEGNNLVHLLQKHGKNVRIDLQEAKELGVGLLRRTG